MSPRRFFLTSLIPVLLCGLQPAPAQNDPTATPEELIPPEVELEIVPGKISAETASPVVVKKIDSLMEIPEEFWTHASYTDYLLKNDQAAFTFGAIPEDGPDVNPTRQGCILDMFTSSSGSEGFHLLQTTTDARAGGRTYVANLMDYSMDPETGSGEVAVYGNLIRDENVTVDTVYRMEKTWPGVLATTTITNDGPEEITLPVVADFLNWGAMMPFASGSGWVNATGVITDCEFVFARFEDQIVYIQPESGYFEYQSSIGHALACYAKDVKLAPGESTKYARWILVGQSDPADLFSFVRERKGPEAYGFLAGRIVERVTLPDGRVMESATVSNAEVRLAVVRRDDLPKTYVLRPYIYTLSDEFGNFQLTLPPGEYSVAATSAARVFQPNNTGIPIQGGGKITPGTVVVSRPSSLVFEIFDAATGDSLPGKISIIPLRGTTAPDLGPPGELASGSAAYSPSGKGIIELGQGSYRVVASHGNEYHSQEKRVNMKQLRNETVKFHLERAFDSPGWISADVGVMTNKSPHSRIKEVERVVTAVAEGVEWLVTADLNVATDLRPAVERIGAGNRIRVSHGLRLGSDMEHRRGEYLLFPLELCATGREIDLNPLFASKTPQEAVGIMRAICPNSVIVAHRPIYPFVGMLSAQGYDFRARTFPEGEVFADVDAFQIWEGKRQAIIEQGLDAYKQLLVEGRPITPIAYSLSAGSFNDEPGYPRIYLPSDTDDPRKFDVEGFARSIREGRVLITNGPFIDLRVNGTPMGTLITDTDGTVDVSLKVMTPNWANVTDITVNLNGGFARKFILPAGSVDPEIGQVYPKPGEEETFRLAVREDSILTVIVQGDTALAQDPVNPLWLPTQDTDVIRGQYSLAISAPVFLDVDGNGVLDLDPKAFQPQDTTTSEEPLF